MKLLQTFALGLLVGLLTIGVYVMSQQPNVSFSPGAALLSMNRGHYRYWKVDLYGPELFSHQDFRSALFITNLYVYATNAVLWVTNFTAFPYIANDVPDDALMGFKPSLPAPDPYITNDLDGTNWPISEAQTREIEAWLKQSDAELAEFLRTNRTKGRP